MGLSKYQRKSRRHKGIKYLSERNHLTKIRKFRTKLINNATYPERKFRKALDLTGLPYEFQKIIKTKTKYKIVDFFLFNCNIVIEIDGSHHFTAYGQFKDSLRTKALQDTSRVGNIIRFSNKFVINNTEDKLISALYDELEVNEGLICPALPSKATGLQQTG